jgi:hypothetical protein
MSHRTQVALSDTQYRRLLTESEQSGLSLAGLVRRAVDNCYGQPAPEEVVRALRASFGSWQDRDFDGERLRRGHAARAGPRLRTLSRSILTRPS